MLTPQAAGDGLNRVSPGRSPGWPLPLCPLPPPFCQGPGGNPSASSLIFQTGVRIEPMRRVLAHRKHSVHTRLADVERQSQVTSTGWREGSAHVVGKASAPVRETQPHRCLCGTGGMGKEGSRSQGSRPGEDRTEGILEGAGLLHKLWTQGLSPWRTKNQKPDRAWSQPGCEPLAWPAAAGRPLLGLKVKLSLETSTPRPASPETGVDVQVAFRG